MASSIYDSAIDNMTLLQLKTFREARDQEVAEYQLNINNYIRAIAKIEFNLVIIKICKSLEKLFSNYWLITKKDSLSL